MGARPRVRSLWLPAVYALGLHLAAAGWWFGGPRGAAFAAAAPVAQVVTLFAVEAAPATTNVVPAPPPSPAVPARLAAPPDLPRQIAPALPTPARPAVHSVPVDADEAGAPGSGLAMAPLEPAYLAGEPLIDLGPDQALITGRLALRLVIDDTGHVIDSETLSHEGLPEDAAATLVNAFTGYVYMPARRAGRAIRSVVTMVITVRDGQGASEPVP